MDKIVIACPDMGSGILMDPVKARYAEGVARAGAVMEDIPWGASEEEVRKYLEKSGGVLFSGGEDIEPALYGAERLPVCGKANPARDELEMLTMRLAMEMGKPILAICRGLQLLNIFQGGTLHQDIKKIQKLGHMDPVRRFTEVHQVTVLQGTKLADIVGVGGLGVNSTHHQAVDQLGEGLKITAVSEDGFVEGLEFVEPGGQFCVAVQWHPERLADHSAAHQALFDALVEAAKAQQG